MFKNEKILILLIISLNSINSDLIIRSPKELQSQFISKLNNNITLYKKYRRNNKNRLSKFW